MSAILNQISPSQWSRVLSDWNTESTHADQPKVVSIYVVRSDSEIQLVAAPEDRTPAGERLSIENCIQVTERVIFEYKTIQDYDQTRTAILRLKEHGQLDENQTQRINQLLGITSEMSRNIEHCSLQ